MDTFSRCHEEVGAKRRRLDVDRGAVGTPFINDIARGSGWTGVGQYVYSFLMKAVSPVAGLWRSSTNDDHAQAETNSPKLRRRCPAVNVNHSSVQMQSSPAYCTRSKAVMHSRVNCTNGIGKKGADAANPIELESSDEDDDVTEIHLPRQQNHALRSLVAEGNRGFRGVLALSGNSNLPSVSRPFRQVDRGAVTQLSSRDFASDVELSFTTARSFEKEDTPADDDVVEDFYSPLGHFSSRRKTTSEAMECTYEKHAPRSPPITFANATELRAAYGLGSPEAEASESVNTRKSYVTSIEEEPEEDFLPAAGSVQREESIEILSGQHGQPGVAPGAQEDDDIIFDDHLSPSPQPDHSASRTVSPDFFQFKSAGRIDRWRRRSRRDILGFPRNRPNPLSSGTGNSSYTLHLKKRFCGVGDTNIINMGAKERYRQLLEEVGAGNISFDSSPFSPLRSEKGFKSLLRKSPHSKRIGSLEMLRRGRAALDILAREGITVTSAVGSPEQIDSNDDEVQVIGGIFHGEAFTCSAPSTSSESQETLSRHLSSLEIPFLRRRSYIHHATETESKSPSVDVVWDRKRDEAFKAMLDAEKNSSALAKHRLSLHRQEAELRSRQAEALKLEKQLREKARRDEEINLEEELRKKLSLTGYVFRDRSIKVTKDEFPELTEKALLLIEKVWDRKAPLDEKFSGTITRKDLLTLRGLDWLNDEVINIYLSMICERSKADISLPKVYAFTTFFYSSLVSKGYAGVKRWTRKVDIFSFDILLVPVHLGAHWCMAVIDFQNKQIEYYDSMGGNNDVCLETLREYLVAESLDKKKKQFDLSGWGTVCRKDIPQQMNGSDCGMFSCKFAEFASRRAQIVFTQEHMPYFRKRMVYEICTHKLM